MERIDYIIMSCAALVLVFVGIALLPSAPTPYNLDAAYEKGCAELRRTCDPSQVASLTVLVSGKTTYTLGVICAQYGYDDTVSCANSCGCNMTGKGKKLMAIPITDYSDNPIRYEPVGEEEEEAEIEYYYGV